MLDDSYCCLNVDKLQNTVALISATITQKRRTHNKKRVQLGLHDSNAKRKVINSETHVQFNFGDTISDLDVAFRIRSSFSNPYCCVETVNY